MELEGKHVWAKAIIPVTIHHDVGGGGVSGANRSWRFQPDFNLCANNDQSTLYKWGAWYIAAHTQGSSRRITEMPSSGSWSTILSPPYGMLASWWLTSSDRGHKPTPQQKAEEAAEGRRRWWQGVQGQAASRYVAKGRTEEHGWKSDFWLDKKAREEMAKVAGKKGPLNAGQQGIKKSGKK